MTVARQALPFVCARCLYRLSRNAERSLQNGEPSRYSTQTAALPHENEQSTTQEGKESGKSKHAKSRTEEPGGMSRRLAQMTEEPVEQGGRSAKKAIGEGGFSEELRRQLEARIQDSSFKSENPAAFAQLNMPVRLETHQNDDCAD